MISADRRSVFAVDRCRKVLSVLSLALLDGHYYAALIRGLRTEVIPRTIGKAC